MLNELLKKQKEELTLQIVDKETLNNVKNDLDEEISKLNEEIDQYKVQLAKKISEFKKIDEEKKKIPFKSFFREKFSKKYNDNIDSIKDELSKGKRYIESLISQKAAKEKEYKINEEKIVSIEEIEKELSLLENEEYGIQRLIKNNLDVLNNKDVMIDLIQKDLKYICFDKSDNEEVYFYLIRRASEIIMEQVHDWTYDKEKLLKDMDKCDETERKKREVQIAQFDTWIDEKEKNNNNLKYFFEEIRNPKKPLVGKYKIPHEFLFEAIRKGILVEFNKNSNKDLTQSAIANAISNVCKNYIAMDCNYSNSYGKMIEDLYTSEDVDLYFHGTIDSQETVDKICRDGVMLRGEYCRDLSCTTVSQKQNAGDFLTCLNYNFMNGRTVILAIPKKENLILGNNTNSKDDVYILPQYVLGEVEKTSSGPRLRKNSIPIEERTVYDYTYVAHKDIDKESMKDSKHR